VVVRHETGDGEPDLSSRVRAARLGPWRCHAIGPGNQGRRSVPTDGNAYEEKPTSPASLPEACGSALLSNTVAELAGIDPLAWRPVATPVGRQASALGPSRTSVSASEFRAIFDKVCTWGRWGEEDERGALNHQHRPDLGRRQAGATRGHGHSQPAAEDPGARRLSRAS
jgi:hypothetical protein